MILVLAFDKINVYILVMWGMFLNIQASSSLYRVNLSLSSGILVFPHTF